MSGIAKLTNKTHVKAEVQNTVDKLLADMDTSLQEIYAGIQGIDSAGINTAKIFNNKGATAVETAVNNAGGLPQGQTYEAFARAQFDELVGSVSDAVTTASANSDPKLDKDARVSNIKDQITTLLQRDTGFTTALKFARDLAKAKVDTPPKIEISDIVGDGTNPNTILAFVKQHVPDAPVIEKEAPAPEPKKPQQPEQKVTEKTAKPTVEAPKPVQKNQPAPSAKKTAPSQTEKVTAPAQTKTEKTTPDKEPDTVATEKKPTKTSTKPTEPSTESAEAKNTDKPAGQPSTKTAPSQEKMPEPENEPAKPDADKAPPAETNNTAKRVTDTIAKHVKSVDTDEEYQALYRAIHGGDNGKHGSDSFRKQKEENGTGWLTSLADTFGPMWSGLADMLKGALSFITTLVSTGDFGKAAQAFSGTQTASDTGKNIPDTVHKIRGMDFEDMKYDNKEHGFNYKTMIAAHEAGDKELYGEMFKIFQKDKVDIMATAELSLKKQAQDNGVNVEVNTDITEEYVAYTKSRNVTKVSVPGEMRQTLKVENVSHSPTAPSANLPNTTQQEPRTSRT